MIRWEAAGPKQNLWTGGRRIRVRSGTRFLVWPEVITVVSIHYRLAEGYAEK